ncbi:hypothetical protein ACMTN4_07420 [Rhodococcus globerulus]|uniref:hypothetical protein n=1 Tax=Rhodococcus globerulus TaxID=33008 RepID=UPI0039ED1F0C
MTPEQIREEAKRRLQTALGTYLNKDPQHMSAVADVVLAVLSDLLPTSTRYAVSHPVNGEPRFAGESLEDCERYAEEFETHVIRQYLTEWTTHE